MRLTAGLLALVVSVLVPVSAAAQQPPRPSDTGPADGPIVGDITKIDHETFKAIAARLPAGHAPKIDGKLDDADWQDPWLSATEQPGRIPDRLLSALTRQVLQAFQIGRAHV